MTRDDTLPRRGLVKEVTSLANPVIKDIKALSQKKNREASGHFMAEGLKLVIDALDTGWHIDTLIYAKSAKGKPLVDKVAARVVASGGLVLEVTEKVLSSVTHRDNPQSVVGIFQSRWKPLNEVKRKAGETWVALDRVRDPGNLGTIIRTADAAGASGVILIGETTDPFALGTWCALPPGWLTDGTFTSLERPEGRFAFAGGDIAPDGTGWIEGAVASGGRAAATVAAMLERTPLAGRGCAGT